MMPSQLNNLCRAILLGLLVTCNFAFAQEELPQEAAQSTSASPALPREPAKLLVFPSEINLTSKNDRQTIVAQLQFDDGVTEDATKQIQLTLADESLVQLDENRLSGLADGETSLSVTFNDLSVKIPVKISSSDNELPISFKNDVIPVFSRTGCNAGSCHGAARGKDGFQLSLYGFDPSGDYHRITREMPGRRIDLALPDDCLLINKATGNVSHTGGALVKRDSEYYATLIRWLKDGAKNDAGPVPTVDRVELYPTAGLIDGTGQKQQLTVRAIYSDGSDRDVTTLAHFMTNNDNVALVDSTGIVTGKNRGEAFITARFDTHTVGAEFLVLPKNLPFAWSEPEAPHYIDRLINAKLKKLRINPSPLCSDAEFIRRVSLDICGTVPTANEVTTFASDDYADKRAALVDQLLVRKEFVDIWVMKWSELLQIRSTNQVSYKATLLYYAWLQQQISNNVPVDEMIQSLLASEGGTFTNAATNFYQNEPDKLKIAENVAQVFLGMRIQCAQCHNHPFDRWTMNDYYSFAAFFTQVARKAAEDPRERIVFDRGRGQTKHPVTGETMRPKFLGGEYPETKGKDRRAVVAEWITSKENPYFAKNLSNIVWAHFFGRGIVHEVDDVRISNPAVNQPLLDELGKKFIDYEYDFKKLVRDICTSRTYQRSTQTTATNEIDSTNFSHANLRRIRAEVLLDVISEITETKNKFKGLPVGSSAVQIADGNTSTYFLSTFGRAKRETVCSCEVKTDANLSQALHFLNGKTVNSKIKQGKVVERMLESGMSVPDVIDALYLRCLARKPTDQERQRLSEEVSGVDQVAALQDIFWALLNSREFVFNH